MEGDYKIVEFEKYCPTCKYYELDENEDPCYECLAEPANIDSHKPIKYEEK